MLLVNQSGSGADSIIIAHNLSNPFDSSSYYHVSSKYGNRIDPINKAEKKFHAGIDLGANCGTPVLSSADGIVYEVGYQENGLGNYIYIMHNLENLGVVYSIYGHLQDNSIIVEPNQPVFVGDNIGLVGTTGYSTGCHLHFAISKSMPPTKENYIDPTFVINGLK